MGTWNNEFSDILDQFFLDGAPRGINANLCEALAGFVDGDEATALDLIFAWAPARAVPAGTPSSLRVGTDLAPFLREGARLMRTLPTRAPEEDFELEGIVVRLKSEDPEEGGVATVAAHVEGQSRRVQVPMGPEDYKLAIQAHEERQLLRCEGELLRVGGKLQLERVRHVTLIQDDD